MGRPPSVQDVHTTMTSALASKLDGIHELPYGVVLANRDKRGSWGRVNAYYAYCHRCCEWLDFAAACSHKDCSGRNWDKWLGNAEWDWWPKIKEIRNRVDRGEHPFYDGIFDRRSCDAIKGSVFPALVAGERQLLRGPSASGLSSQLEVMVDIPSMDSANGHPLRVLMYFHGHGGEDCGVAPASLPGCVIIAVQCPTFVSEGLRCFWFTEGPGGAWDRHQHDKLRRCDVMLAAVETLLEHILIGLEILFSKQGVKREVMLVGVSMGGQAVLEFARAFPARVCAAAVFAGLYDGSQIRELVQATAAIPFLLVHSRGDAACPFRTIEELYCMRTAGGKHHVKDPKRSRTRISESNQSNHNGDKSVVLVSRAQKLQDGSPWCVSCAETEAWFADGFQHTPTEEELLAAIKWVLRRA